MRTIKDYLTTELARNKRYAALYTAIMHAAFGRNDQVFIAHHLSFEENGDLASVDEIPSADTLLGDHVAMRTVFGERYLDVIVDCFKTPVEKRDECLQAHWDALQAGKEIQFVTQDDPADNLDSMVGWQNGDKGYNTVPVPDYPSVVA